MRRAGGVALLLCLQLGAARPAPGHLGNVTSVTPPTRPAHAFDYTAVDQVELYTPPEAGFTPRATSYDYNADRQVTLITRPDGQTIVPSYEPNGRLDFLTLPTGTIDVGYDAVGRVESITAPGGVGHGFVYDGSFVTSLSTTGPVAGAVSFDYDGDLRLSGQTVLGGPVIGYGYDADGLLTSAGSLSLTRNPASGLLETTTLAATTDARTRTSFGELDTWTGSYSGAPLYDYDLDRDAAGRITKKTETIGAVTAVWEYTYHPQRGWLTEVRKDSVVVASYGYDDNGNRTSWSDFWGSGAATYDDQDRQLTAGPVDYTYTANGERLTKTAGPDVTGYLYDVRGALLAVDLPSGIEIDYLVDASGRRIGKKINGVLTKGWIYAGGLSPLAETDGSGAVTQTYVYATKGNVPDYLTAGGETYRIFTDHLGSVRLVVNAATGAIAQRIDYDAWGRITLDTNPGFQPFGFAGGIYDHQTGLTRFGARDYDPETGRWTAKDPIGFGGGSAGLYEYCSNDPVNRIDPSGLYDASDFLIDAFGWLDSDFGRATADTLVGLGDGASFGLTRLTRPDHLHQHVNYDSLSYKAGFATGATNTTALLAVTGGPALAGAGLSGSTALTFTTGAAGEAYLLGRIGGAPQQRAVTSLGLRIIDVVKGRIGYEAKVGFVSYGQRVLDQIAKDAEIVALRINDLTAYEWHFLRSAATGQIGADPRVLQALAEAGIKVVFH
jgi:RHS repeat-associated protein